MLAEHRVPHPAARAGPLTDEPLFSDARQRLRTEGLGVVRNLHQRSTRAPRHATERLIQGLGHELFRVVGGSPFQTGHLLRCGEVAAVGAVATVHAPQHLIVGQGLVVVGPDPEVLPARWARSTEEALLVRGHGDRHSDLVAGFAQQPHAGWEPVSGHGSPVCLLGVTQWRKQWQACASLRSPPSRDQPR